MASQVKFKFINTAENIFIFCTVRFKRVSTRPGEFPGVVSNVLVYSGCNLVGLG